VDFVAAVDTSISKACHMAKQLCQMAERWVNLKQAVGQPELQAVFSAGTAHRPVF
jgi:hypothetical protein